MGADGLLGVGVPATQPVWLLWVKLAIVVFSLIALALGAYGLSISIIGAGGMTIFVVRACQLPGLPRICSQANFPHRLFGAS